MPTAIDHERKPHDESSAILPVSLADAEAQSGRHFARYTAALPYARGRHVLDAACGSGYGTAFLATVAASVTGIDLSAPLLSHASQYFLRPNVEFRRHDLHLPLQPARPFDLVTCFETLEHVRDPQCCLDMIVSALAADGTLIASVPNGELERQHHPKDYHERQFTAAGFESLLRSRFVKVDLFDQVYVRNVRHYLHKLLRGSRHLAGNYRLSPGLSARAKTWVGICRGPERSG